MTSHELAFLALAALLILTGFAGAGVPPNLAGRPAKAPCPCTRRIR